MQVVSSKEGLKVFFDEMQALARSLVAQLKVGGWYQENEHQILMAAMVMH